MLNYNQEILLDSDTHRYGSYYATMYEYNIPEKEILQQRDKEMRRILKKHNNLCTPCEQR